MFSFNIFGAWLALSNWDLRKWNWIRGDYCIYFQYLMNTHMWSPKRTFSRVAEEIGGQFLLWLQYSIPAQMCSLFWALPLLVRLNSISPLLKIHFPPGCRWAQSVDLKMLCWVGSLGFSFGIAMAWSRIGCRLLEGRSWGSFFLLSKYPTSPGWPGSLHMGRAPQCILQLMTCRLGECVEGVTEQDQQSCTSPIPARLAC